jgi:small subunit ribosomal protein S10
LKKMAQRARISLSGTDPKKVDNVCRQIKTISEKTGVAISGPIPLPTKRLVVPCRKGPDGGATSTIDRWEMRVHKRLIDLDADERALRQLMRIQVPDGVNIEIVLRS